ncbi:MAG: hypothetical protein PVJ60_00590 [Phycisphaerales bacterium]
MKVKCKKFPGGKYNGPVSFLPGDIKEVSDAEAKRLTTTWPKYFEIVGGSEKAKGKPAKNKAMKSPRKNK